MKKIAIILIVSFMTHNVQTEQPTPTVIELQQTAAPDSDLLETFDDVPNGDQPIQERPLPWYLDLIQKPAASILISTCHGCDWLCKQYTDTRARLVAWWCAKKIRDNRTITQEMV